MMAPPYNNRVKRTSLGRHGACLRKPRAGNPPVFHFPVEHFRPRSPLTRALYGPKIEMERKMKNNWIYVAAFFLFMLLKVEASEKRNLYMMRDSSNGGAFHFKMKENLKGKILIDDRPNQPEDRPRFSFWVDSSDMMKIPRNSDDQRWPWFEITNAEQIRKGIQAKAPKINLECVSIEAQIKIQDYNYIGVQHTEAADAAAIQLEKIGKIVTGTCELDLRWWGEIVKRKDAYQFKQ
jgi:hypothetical protein